MAEYDAALEVAIRAAEKAGHLIRMHAGKIGRQEVREKNLHDLVTEIDVQSQRMIVEVLQASFPDAAVLAEEGDLSGGQEKVKGLRWIVDPIDGTTNFTHGMPPYAVSIALEDDGELMVGVVLEVGRWELFTAVKGKGAFANGVPLSVSNRSDLSESLLSTGFPYKRFENLEAILSLLGKLLPISRGIRRCGAASVDLAYVAAGRFEVFYETGLMPWDLAAGALLINEAGGRVTNFANEVDRLFDRQVLATNGFVHEDMLGYLSEMKHLKL